MIPEAWRRGVVAVVGLGRSGIAATRLLARNGVRVYASDAAERPAGGGGAGGEGGGANGNGVQQLRSLPDVAVDVGGHDLQRIQRATALVLSPGVPPDAPPVAAARQAGVEIISELDLGFRALTGIRTIAITGTNGKTTTTALVGHLLRAAGLRAAEAGNIGRPLCDVALAGERLQWLAVEVSSFQLHDSPAFAPEIGVLTNLAPDHLDRYQSVEAYYADKRLLFRNARPENVWVLNGDDPAALRLADGAAGSRALFSLRGPTDAWYDTAERTLRLGGAALLPRDELRLLGDHNVANALAAALAVHEAGIGLGQMAAGLRSFRALPHRLEPVREVNGVLWINDSKATNVASTTVAIEAMDRPFILLLGGRHKGEPYTSLGERLVGRCRGIVAYGEAGSIIERDLGGVAPLVRGTTFEDVMARAWASARPGNAVLLSPACSSYDMFTNFEERGATFRKIVEAL